MKRILTREGCYGFLRKCADAFVSHRDVPDREIWDAIDLAYGDSTHQARMQTGPRRPQWPAANWKAIEKAIASTHPLFDGETDTHLRTEDVLPALFKPGELVCVGAVNTHAAVMPVAEAMPVANRLQFIVPNPMLGPSATNLQGRPSARCQANVRERRHIVAEFDSPQMTPRIQAQVATALGRVAPLVLVVHSGGKSLHCWFRADKLNVHDQARFFALACLLGADPSRWDACGWLRMPGGLRVKDGQPPVRQKILYLQTGELP